MSDVLKHAVASLQEALTEAADRIEALCAESPTPSAVKHHKARVPHFRALASYRPTPEREEAGLPEGKARSLLRRGRAFAHAALADAQQYADDDAAEDAREYISEVDALLGEKGGGR